MKSAFEKYMDKAEKCYFLANYTTLESDKSMCKGVWLAALKWVLRQKKSSIIYGAKPNVDPDKIKVEIKKIEAEK